MRIINYLLFKKVDEPLYDRTFHIWSASAIWFAIIAFIYHLSNMLIWVFS